MGDKILPSYVRILVNHDIRIPIKQPGSNGKQELFVFRGSLEFIRGFSRILNENPDSTLPRPNNSTNPSPQKNQHLEDDISKLRVAYFQML